MKKAKPTKKKYQEGGEEAKGYRYFLNKETKNKEKEKEVSERRAKRVAYRYSKQEGSKVGKDSFGRSIVVSGKNPKKSVTREDDERMTTTKKRTIPKIFKKGGSTKKR